jgi:type I restriction enzyme S subunit
MVLKMRKMKASGIEWIGEIPEGWEVSKLKYLGSYVNGYPFKPDDWGDKGKPIIRIQDLTGSNDSPNYYDGDIDAKYHIKNGDILVSWAATLDAFIWNKGDGLLNQHIFKAIPQEEKITSYFFFWMIKEAMQNMNNDNKHGIFMQHVTLDVFNNFSVPLPPLSEQRRIATYLFQKISEADIMLDDTLSSITGYKKLKQAVITQAVTKGVRGEREMKDSGIDYIGQIPSEWFFGKLRNVGDTQNGISKSSEFFGKGFPFVSYSDVYKNYSLSSTVSGLVDSTPEEQKRYSVKKGDIFFTRTSETIEEVGFSCVCEKDIPNATFAGFLIRVRPFSDKLYTPYAKYYFRSSHLRFYLVKEMNLVTRASLGQSLLKSMPVLFPPLEEQKEIADYLDVKCAEIDGLIAKKEQLAKELESYKKSLIYEVVTGKREV